MAAMGNVTEPMMSGFSGTSNPRLPVAILSAALFGMALTSLRAADFEEPLSLFSQASSWMHTAAEPVGVEFFADYCGVIQGNPVGGQSQGVAYSQYLPFGFEWKEPLGWRGGSLWVSAVSGAGRDLSESIGNALTVSQAWNGSTLFLYQAYLVQKAFELLFLDHQGIFRATRHPIHHSSRRFRADGQCARAGIAGGGRVVSEPKGCLK